MTMQGQDNRVRISRRRAEEAIALAMEGRWEEAATLNRELVKMASGDVEAWNRLGKALLELRDCSGAAEAFQYVLGLSPGNPIARKNLARLAQLEGAPVSHNQRRWTNSNFFIQESGKTIRVVLLSPAEPQVLAAVSAGEAVEMERQGNNLAVHLTSGPCLGRLPAGIGHRLAGLMDGGNEYQAAVFTTSHEQVIVMLRETFQHTSQRNIVSFPGQGARGGSSDPGSGPDFDDEELELVDQDHPVSWDEDDVVIPSLELDRLAASPVRAHEAEPVSSAHDEALE